MRIALALYEEDVESVEDLVGDVRMESGGEIIREHSTYLDSWLTAIVQGLEALQVETAVSIELLEEPDPLRFELSGSRISVSYGPQTLTVPCMADLEEAVALATAAFLRDVERLTGACEGEPLAELRAFMQRRLHAGSGH